MNKALYWILAVILIAVVLFGGYKLVKHYKNTGTNNNPQQSMNGSNNPTIVPSTSNSGSAGLMNKTDTSNQQLDQDLQDVQGSLNKLNNDQNQAGQANSSQSSDIPSQ